MQRLRANYARIEFLDAVAAAVACCGCERCGNDSVQRSNEFFQRVACCSCGRSMYKLLFRFCLKYGLKMYLYNSSFYLFNILVITTYDNIVKARQNLKDIQSTKNFGHIWNS